jgi:hypothetical protein
MVLLCGRAGRLTVFFGVLRPGQHCGSVAHARAETDYAADHEWAEKIRAAQARAVLAAEDTADRRVAHMRGEEVEAELVKRDVVFDQELTSLRARKARLRQFYIDETLAAAVEPEPELELEAS